jgi:hypothetical protein
MKQPEHCDTVHFGPGNAHPIVAQDYFAEPRFKHYQRQQNRSVKHFL